jgi:hypothetical protein
MIVLCIIFGILLTSIVYKIKIHIKEIHFPIAMKNETGRFINKICKHEPKLTDILLAKLPSHGNFSAGFFKRNVPVRFLETRFKARN